MDFDFESEPLGHDTDGEPVYLRDIWPSPQAVSYTHLTLPTTPYV